MREILEVTQSFSSKAIKLDVGRSSKQHSVSEGAGRWQRQAGGVMAPMFSRGGSMKLFTHPPLSEQKVILHRGGPRNWPTDTIVATCNPDDDNNYGHAMIYSVSGFAARTDEHCSDLLDHTIPHSVTDSHRRGARNGPTGVDSGVRPGASS